jgi:DNA-binding transcriptional regulator YbjK
MAEGGLGAITHRAVAARAGLPSSTAGYFFESIDDLAAEALRVHIGRGAAELRALAQPAAGRPASGDRLVAALAHRCGAGELALALPSVLLEASRDPVLRPTVAEGLDTLRQVTEDLLRTAGLPIPEASAPAFQALLDGFTLRVLAEPDNPPSPALIADAVDALLTGSLLDAGERRAAKGRLRP